YYNLNPKISISPWERPLDISFVLDKLLEHPILKERIDCKRIGVAGFSQGGMTALWVAGAKAHFKEIQKDCEQTIEVMKKYHGINFNEKDFEVNYQHANRSYHDERVKAAFSMAPGIGGVNEIFTAHSFHEVNIPVHIVSGEEDDIVPPKQNAELFARHIAHSKLSLIPHAGHWVFLNEPTEKAKMAAEEYEKQKG